MIFHIEAHGRIPNSRNPHVVGLGARRILRLDKCKYCAHLAFSCCFGCFPVYASYMGIILFCVFFSEGKLQTEDNFFLSFFFFCFFLLLVYI